MLVRGESLAASMSKYLIDQIAGTSNIVVQTHSEVLEAFGQDRLEALLVGSPQGECRRAASSLFIFIGAAPKTHWLPEAILRDSKGFVLSGRDLLTDGRLPISWKEQRDPYLLETSVPGIFVAGDVRHGSVKRVASSVGEGSTAVQFMHQYLAQF
jgi:thioredoxin reductase (NADPH)